MPDIDRLAALHAASFTNPSPWSGAAIRGLLALPGVFLIEHPSGFAMGRRVLDEAELLTLAVAPAARRQGVGAELLAGFSREARARGAARGLLEVAADNGAAIALYQGQGWHQVGRRRGYYRDGPGPAVDALLMECTFAAPMG